ncbi:hypothetical protein [Flagellimonas flava]|uniref:hypothetical protein n=1 Tax=Flagellimonas flava TaxID=570519 RepID=UPI003D655208
MVFLTKSAIWLSFLLLSTVLFGQKGMGDAKGVSQMDSLPNLIVLEGVIKSVSTGPCELSKGNATSGTHIWVLSNDELYNVHLGPTARIKKFVREKTEQPLTATVFRTHKLPKNHYIAQKIEINGSELVLRDGYLKPFWANKKCKAVWK